MRAIGKSQENRKTGDRTGVGVQKLIGPSRKTSWCNPACRTILTKSTSELAIGIRRRCQSARYPKTEWLREGSIRKGGKFERSSNRTAAAATAHWPWPNGCRRQSRTSPSMTLGTNGRCAGSCSTRPTQIGKRPILARPLAGGVLMRSPGETIAMVGLIGSLDLAALPKL